MKIIYFDTLSLIYSHQYVNSDPAISGLFNEHKSKPRAEFLKLVKPDFESASRLAKTALEKGFLLFPTGSLYNRQMLIDAGIFSDRQLAPEVDLTWKLRLDDASPIRRIIAHANSLNVQEWYACGDIAHQNNWGKLHDHYIHSTFGQGVDEALVAAISNKIQST